MGTFLAGFKVSVLSFFVFGLFHSIGAQDRFKQKLSALTSPFLVDHFWRLIYCAVSWILFYTIWIPTLRQLPAVFYRELFPYPIWLHSIAPVLKIIGVLFCYSAFFQFDYLSFIGLKQAAKGIAILTGCRWIPSSPPIAGLERLEVKGIYRYIRHPIMTGLLLMWMPDRASVNAFFTFLLVLAYTWIGTYFEEKQLLSRFGAPYREYRAAVGGFLPKGRVSG